jgi:hypothetical protein
MEELMKLIVRTRLPPEELQFLRELSHAYPELLSRVGHTDRLLKRGFATQYTDGTGITQLGFAKLVYETTRAAWFPARA